MSCVRLCFAGCVVQNLRRHGGRARTGCQKCVLHLLVNYGSQGKCLWVMLHKTNKFVIGNATKLVLSHRGPPSYLRQLTDKLEAKAAATLERLQNWPVYDDLRHRQAKS